MYGILDSILATNRDEFLHRPTEDAHWHSFEHAAPPALPVAATKTVSTAGTVLPAQVSITTTISTSSSAPGPILSGRDLQAGGTWLGLSRAGGRIALLTNITEPLAKWKVSRGELVAGFLTMSEDGQTSRTKGEDDSQHVDVDVLKRWEDRMGVNRGGGKDEYAGFNLLLLAPRVESQSQSQLQGGEDGGSPRRVVYDARFVTNHGGGGPLASRPLSAAERRCGGISNGVDHSHLTRLETDDTQGSRDKAVKVEVTNDAADDWPKVRRARGDFSKLLQTQDDNAEGSDMTEDELVERLFGVLEWHPTPTPVAHRGELRNTVHVLPFCLSLSIGANKINPPQNSDNATTSTTAPDIKAAQTEVTVPAPRSASAPGSAPGTASTPMNIQGSAAGPAKSQVPKPTESTTKPKTILETESTPAFYGTRLATVMLVPRDPAREALLIERDIWALGADGPDPASGQNLRDSGVEERPVRVDKNRQRVFRFRMDFGNGEP